MVQKGTNRCRVQVEELGIPDPTDRDILLVPRSSWERWHQWELLRASKDWAEKSS